MLFIVSSVQIAAGEGDEITVEVAHAAGDKCPRCWRFVTERVPAGELEGLCLRCADAIGDPVASTS
jgi:isoleucyl-tRNA synthetase